MKVSEIIGRINDGEKINDLAVNLGMSKDSLRRKLKAVNYTFNNSTKKYEFIGELSEKGQIDDSEFVESNHKNVQNKVRKKSEKIQNEVKENRELVLTEDEIKFVKDSYNRRTFTDKQFEVSWEKSKLPPRKPEKKTPYIISEKTFTDFKDFSEKMENDYRITQNELVEIALRKLMDEWR